MSKQFTTRRTTSSSLTLLDRSDEEPKTATEKQRRFSEDFNMEHSTSFELIRVRAVASHSRTSTSPNCIYLG